MINFLSFSDGAKFADIARNLVMGFGYGDSFTFWSNTIFGFLKQNTFSASWTPPLMPFSIAAFFKIFGINDFAVIATSFFYFLLTLVFVFLLSKKVFKNNLTAILSTLAVGFNYDLINYATDGASESPFIFEIVAGAYFISLRKKWADGVALLFLILLYFTRPQAFIYIAGLILYWLLLNFKTEKAVLYFILISLASIWIDRNVLTRLSGQYFLYSIYYRGLSQVIENASGGAISDALRGTASAAVSYASVFKNIFYNLYNFFKLLPQIMSPYLFAIFAIGIFTKAKDRIESSFKIASLFMVIVTLLVTAASIPFFRYIHPIVPFVYIIAVATLVLIIEQIIKDKRNIILVSTFLILIFGVGQTLGVIFLDSRFEKDTYNVGKPPVYVVLSQILKANTTANQIVITNLDTWGSWYGERKTIWFPLEPNQIIDPTTGKIPFDAIYLTSYLIDDPNYSMGADWREILDNPTNPGKWVCNGCAEISKEFKLKGVYKIPASNDYEKQDTTGVLLVKKSN